MSKTPTKPRKRGPGRPSLGDDGATQVAVRFPNRMLRAIDEHIAQRLDGPDRAAVIRELVADGMRVRKIIK